MFFNKRQRLQVPLSNRLNILKFYLKSKLREGRNFKKSDLLIVSPVVRTVPGMEKLLSKCLWNE